MEQVYEKNALEPVLMSQHPELIAEWGLAKEMCSCDADLKLHASDIRTRFDAWDLLRFKAWNSFMSVKDSMVLVVTFLPTEDMSDLALTSKAWFGAVGTALEHRFINADNQVGWSALIEAIAAMHGPDRIPLVHFLRRHWPKDKDGYNGAFMIKAFEKLKWRFCNPDPIFSHIVIMDYNQNKGCFLDYPTGHLLLHKALYEARAFNVFSWSTGREFYFEDIASRDDKMNFMPDFIEITKILESGNEKAILNLLSCFKLNPFGKASKLADFVNNHDLFATHTLLAVYLNETEDRGMLINYLSDLIQIILDGAHAVTWLLKGMIYSNLTSLEIEAIVKRPNLRIDWVKCPMKLKDLVFKNLKHEEGLNRLIEEGFDGPHTFEMAQKRSFDFVHEIALICRAPDEVIYSLWEKCEQRSDQMREAILFERSPELIRRMLEGLSMTARVGNALCCLPSIPEIYLPCILETPGIAEDYLGALLSEVNCNKPTAATVQMIRVMMSRLSVEQLDNVMTMGKTFWSPTFDFVYHEELLKLWDSGHRDTILKNADQIGIEPAFELALLALPIEKLKRIRDDISEEQSIFKVLVIESIKKKEARNLEL
jgi:hypothetical protein